MKAAWHRISRREQQLLQALSMFLLLVLAFSLIWQPTRQRIDTAERHYQQQRMLAVQLQKVQPQGGSAVVSQPLSLQISESAAAAGLDLAQMETDHEVLRLALSGEAKALLHWLDRVEHDGATLQALTLEKRDSVLEARVVLK